MREIRPSSLEGGVAAHAIPTPMCDCDNAQRSGVRVPVRIKVTGPVVESNCGGVIRPWRATGSKVPVRKDRAQMSPSLNLIRCDVTGEQAR